MSNSDNPFSEIVEVEITDVFDLHSYSPKEVKIALKEYLKEARKKNFEIVRIILLLCHVVRQQVCRGDFLYLFAIACLSASIDFSISSRLGNLHSSFKILAIHLL